MSESVNLPALGESVTEGTVTRWLKAVGDRVEVDEPLLEVSTDKVDTEIPSPIAGVIEEILVAEDETAEVGAPLVRIGDGSGNSDDSDASGDAAEEPAAEAGEPAAEEPAAEPEPEQETPEPEPASAEASAESEDDSSGGESTEVTLPALGESVTEGTVTRWLKEVGDDVEMDEPLLEVSTDKVDTEIPSPVAGKLQEIRVSEDETAEVGAVLAVIGSGGSAPAKAEGGAEPVAAASSEEREEPVAEPAKAEEKPAETEKPKPAAPTAAEEKPDEAKPAEKKASGHKPAEQKFSGEKSSGSDAAYVTPLVRRLANQQGVDLQSLTGTGVGGRIRKQDVLEAAEAAKKSTEPAAPASAAAA
ncbi:biotin/lipoyl-containing protein, partial [Arthrobacter sp. H20]|uniref:biotin/lipoyl-containing protein n=1 Tax=Arthrobacter sp. H20 TaxID=1267981 RepID=UPI00056655BB